jgi:uncharacterized metal-binding protein YceD (DUF177 family)
MVELNLDRLKPGRSALPLDHEVVRPDRRVQGHLIPGVQARVLGELVVDAMDQKVLVHGSFRAERQMICDRSGAAFRMQYPVEIEVLILRSPGRGPEALDQDDAWVIHQQGGLVDLDDALMEAVILDEPQHVVSPEYRDRDTPSEWILGESEEDEPTDPRWDALRKLRGDSES